MRQALRWLFAGLAAAGFAASLLVHVLALAGRESPFGTATAWLHIGVFVVGVPAAFVHNRRSSEAKEFDFLAVTLRGTPTWVKHVAAAAFVYAILNFVWFIIVTETSYPKGSGREMPEAVKLRGFSGHWMLFYYLAAATFYAQARRRESAPEPGPFRRSI